MALSFRNRRLPVGFLLIGALLFAAIPAAAAEDAPTLTFRPHCEKEAAADCPAFDVLDPTSLKTPPLQKGQMLDIDIILQNPSAAAIQRVRVWLSYDTQILDGTSIALGKSLPIPIPGEADFSAADGQAKIAATAADEASLPKDKTIVVARVQFRVKQAPQGGKSPIAFYDEKADTQGHTYAAAAGDASPNMLSQTLGTLTVIVQPDQTSSAAAPKAGTGAGAIASSASSAHSAGASAASSIARSSAGSTLPASFLLLQVQNVRISTEGTALYIAWDPLSSSQLKGYNVYYGTQTGRYIQRRSLPITGHSLIVRDLPPDATYYAAVRGVNEQDQESAFSQEVAVQIGKPATSTAPLIGRPQDPSDLSADTTPPPNPVSHAANGTNVPGEAGLPSLLIVFLAISAVIGTLLAFRRQMAASPLRTRP